MLLLRRLSCSGWVPTCWLSSRCSMCLPAICVPCASNLCTCLAASTQRGRLLCTYSCLRQIPLSCKGGAANEVGVAFSSYSVLFGQTRSPHCGDAVHSPRRFAQTSESNLGVRRRCGRLRLPRWCWRECRRGRGRVLQPLVRPVYLLHVTPRKRIDSLMLL